MSDSDTILTTHTKVFTIDEDMRPSVSTAMKLFASTASNGDSRYEEAMTKWAAEEGGSKVTSGMHSSTSKSGHPVRHEFQAGNAISIRLETLKPVDELCPAGRLYVEAYTAEERDMTLDDPEKCFTELTLGKEPDRVENEYYATPELLFRELNPEPAMSKEEFASVYAMELAEQGTVDDPERSLSLRPESEGKLTGSMKIGEGKSKQTSKKSSSKASFVQVAFTDRAGLVKQAMALSKSDPKQRIRCPFKNTCLRQQFKDERAIEVHIGNQHLKKGEQADLKCAKCSTIFREGKYLLDHHWNDKCTGKGKIRHKKQRTKKNPKEAHKHTRTSSVTSLPGDESPSDQSS